MAAFELEVFIYCTGANVSKNLCPLLPCIGIYLSIPSLVLPLIESVQISEHTCKCRGRTLTLTPWVYSISARPTYQRPCKCKVSGSKQVK